ncbi:COMPASS component SWD2 [Enteropsectra breve]|nr:COMPASS component SWD2 [Enteropsectra breve]
MDNSEANFFQNIRETRTIAEHGHAKNIEYSITGDKFAYTAGDLLKIYSAEGQLMNIISADIDQLKFLQNNTILHTKAEDILYLSIYDNKYFRKFEGKQGVITALSADPTRDEFMSIGSKGVCMWDIRMQDPTKRIKCKGQLGSIGTENNYFLADNATVKIYDRRNDLGPVHTKHLKGGFNKKAWYTADDSFIVLKENTGFVFLDREGEEVSSLNLEAESNGDSLYSANLILCPAKNAILAYKMQDGKYIGSVEGNDLSNAVIRTRPHSYDFLVQNGGAISLYFM